MERIALTRLTLDPGLQSRVQLDPDHVERLADALRRGEPLPPIDVVSDGATWWVVDGFHRVAAASVVGQATLDAHVTPGEYALALQRAAGANRQHGLPRRPLDVWWTIERLVAADAPVALSSAAIAALVGVDPGWVRRVAGMLAVHGHALAAPLTDAAAAPRRPALPLAPPLPAWMDGWHWRDAGGCHAPGIVLHHPAQGVQTPPAAYPEAALAMATLLHGMHAPAGSHDVRDGDATPVLVIGRQPTPYRAPALWDGAVRAVAADHVRVALPDGSDHWWPVERVRACRAPEARSLVQRAWSAYHDALRRLGDLIARASSYAVALRERGGAGRAPNPLGDLVLRAIPPDAALPDPGGDWYAVGVDVHVWRLTGHTRCMAEGIPFWPALRGNRPRMVSQWVVWLAADELRDAVLHAHETVMAARADWHAALRTWAPSWSPPPPAPPAARARRGASGGFPARDGAAPDAAVIRGAPGAAPAAPIMLIRGGAGGAEVIGAPMPVRRTGVAPGARIGPGAGRPEPPEAPRLSVEQLADALVRAPWLALRCVLIGLALWHSDPVRAAAEVALAQHGGDDEVVHAAAQAIVEMLEDAAPLDADLQRAAWQAVATLSGATENAA